jgi:hypothetical protein
MCIKQASLRIRQWSGAAIDTTASLRHVQFASFVGGDVGWTELTSLSRQGERGSSPMACRKDNWANAVPGREFKSAAKQRAF